MYLKYYRFLVRVPRDPFFAEGDKLCKINEAILLTIEDVEEFLHRYPPFKPVFRMRSISRKYGSGSFPFLKEVLSGLK
jgi:hypothetical protein